jgi:hypothetical protein
MTEVQALRALDSMQQQLASRRPLGSAGQHQPVSACAMALGFAGAQNLDTQVRALAQQAGGGGQLKLPHKFRAKAMAERGSSTLIRGDMEEAHGITVWDFIQSAAAHGHSGPRRSGLTAACPACRQPSRSVGWMGCEMMVGCLVQVIGCL